MNDLGFRNMVNMKFCTIACPEGVNVLEIIVSKKLKNKTIYDSET